MVCKYTGISSKFIFTLILLVANLDNTKWCKIPKKNDWSPGKWVLIQKCSACAIQLVPTWLGLNGFQKFLPLYALDKSSIKALEGLRGFVLELKPKLSKGKAWKLNSLPLTYLCLWINQINDLNVIWVAFYSYSFFVNGISLVKYCQNDFHC